MKPLSMRILKLFMQMGRERLDLHVLFEAGGNEPARREDVLDAIDEMTREGMLEERGGDFYELTEKGKRAITAQKTQSE